MTQFNPLEPLTTAARQFNEQANLAARGLGDSLTQTANTLLQVPAQLPLALPLPNGVGGRRNNPGNSNGNPNGGGQLFPALDQLVPTQALQPLTQVEDVVIPAGLPRPTRVLLDALGPPRRRVVEEPAPAATASENRIVRDTPAARGGVIERSGY
jgi:hypothetical protein